MLSTKLLRRYIRQDSPNARDHALAHELRLLVHNLFQICLSDLLHLLTSPPFQIKAHNLDTEAAIPVVCTLTHHSASLSRSISFLLSLQYSALTLALDAANPIFCTTPRILVVRPAPFSPSRSFSPAQSQSRDTQSKFHSSQLS